MKFQISYHYNEPYFPNPRCRKLRHREVTDVVEVEVPTITQEQARPVFRVTNYDIRQSAFVTTTIYQHDSRLWKVKLKDSFRCNTPHEPATAEDLQNAFDRYYCYNQNADLDAKEIEAAKAIAHATEYLFINGILYTPCGEPMYSIHTFGLGHNHGGTSLFVEYDYNPNIPNQNYFNALHRAEAIEYAVRVAANRGDTESIPDLHDPKYNIEVLDTYAVHRNPIQDHGDGDAFLNMLEDICNSSNSANEAAFFVMCATTEIKTE